MKGPGYKVSHDVRRTWRCPACGREQKLAGDVTSLMCSCREGGVFMTIVAERTVAPRPWAPPSDTEIRAATFGIDDLPVLQPHPSSLPAERTGPRRPRPGSESRRSPQAESSEETPGTPPSSAPSESPEPPASPPEPPTSPENDDWGEGIL